MATSFTVGAFAVIFDEQRRVLLCHRRDRDVWNFPGGGVNSRELPTEAVIRETKEETGLDVEIERLVGIYSKDDRDDLVFVFVCRIVGGELIKTDEANDFGYFDLENLPLNTLARMWHTERMQDAIFENPQPVFRRQIRSLA